jgi:hypothetical protein
MADYYSIMANAVRVLDWNTRDARRQLYERARAALITQMRGTTPALDQSDIWPHGFRWKRPSDGSKQKRDATATLTNRALVPHRRVVATGQGHENWLSELLARASSEGRG